MKRALAAVLAVLVTGSTSFAQVAGAPEGSGSPRFERTACPFKAKAEILDQIRCGYVSVPESRETRGGRQLKLAVAVLRSLGQNPRPDPVVVIQGGPGDKLVGLAPAVITSGAMDRIRADREVVLYDQRGTGFSEPHFCPSLNQEWQRVATLGLGRDQRNARYRELLTRCRESMLNDGIDFARYNSRTNAEDLGDIRRALGFEQWNVIAASYGTRAALAAMRYSPGGIRSGVLDGPIPLDQPLWAHRAVGIADVIRRLSDRCAADPECGSKYPDVEQSFWAGVEEFEREPLVLGGSNPITINGNLYAASIFQALYSRASLPMVPLLIHELRARNESVARNLLQRLMNGSSDASVGLKYTVSCYDDAPLNTPAARTRLRNNNSALDLTDAQTDPGLCAALHPFRAPSEQLRPVVSEIPTLIFSGEFDPATHRSFGPAVARTLRRAIVVDIPGAGHTEALASGCTAAMVVHFINEPAAPLDTACLSSAPSLKFVTDATQLAKRQ